MPRGVYPRKKKPAAAPRGKDHTDKDLAAAAVLLRTVRERLTDRVVRIGNALEQLDALEV